MKKKVILLMIAFLTIVLIGFSFNSINIAKANIIFSDSFQSGNLNNWAVNFGSLTVSSTTTNNGEPFSVQSNVVGANENLYVHSLSLSTPAQNPLYVREYVYITSTSVPSANGDYYQVGGFSTSGGGQFGDGELIVTNVGGTLYWGIFYREATGTANPSGFSRQISTTNSTTTAVPVTIGWTCIELKHLTASNSLTWDGQEQLYVNGNLVVDVTGVANGDRTPADVVIGGWQDITNPSATWTYYIADVIVSDSYIGLNQNLLTTSRNLGTVSPSGSTFYAQGQSVTITATPPTAVSGERYVWQGWTGSGTGQYTGLGTAVGDGTYTATVTMNGNITEAASWGHQYFLTIASAHGGIIGGGWFDAGSTQYAAVTPLTVPGSTNGTQYVFTSWTGDASGTTSPSNAIVMNSPKTATANWKTQYMLTADSAHGTITGAGWQDAGSNATVTLNSLITPGATGIQYLFTRWSTDSAGTTLTSNPITMNAPKTATANWQTQYNLTFIQSGVDSDFTGSVMTVNATSYNNAGFSTWANASDVYSFNYVSSSLVVNANSKQYLLTGVSGNTTALSVTASQPTTLTGAYKTQYYLTVTSTYATASPTTGWFDSGTSITDFVPSLIPGGTGVQFVCTGWSGTGSVQTSGGSSAVTFVISAPSTIAWSWKTQYLVTFNVNPAYRGTTNPSGTDVWADAGAISIIASPQAGYTFSSWSADSGNITISFPTMASSTATINGPGTLTANLAVEPSPTATPYHTATPTNTPTPTSHPTATPTATPTNVSPTPTSTTENNIGVGTYIAGIVVAIVIVAIIGSIIVLRKRKKH